MRNVVVAIGLMAGTVEAGAARQAPGADSILVSAEWVRSRLGQTGVVLVHVGHRMDTTATSELIPGSVEVDYMAITENAGPVQTELPTPDSLRALFRSLGISNDSRVILYSADPIMAARAFVTLEAAGHRRVHVLNGGVAAWKASGGEVTLTPFQPDRPGQFVPEIRGDVVVDADWVRARLGDSGLVLLDTRTREEYDGTGGRRGLPSLGHLAGARLLLWQDLVVQEGSPYLRAPDQLRRIYRAAGVAPGNRVVTYCYVGYRASLTYFVARVLGHEARFYDGSYDDWARRRYPVTKGPTP